MTTIKRYITTLLLVATTLIMSACNEAFDGDTTNNEEPPQKDGMVTMTIVADSQADSQTRTEKEIDEGEIGWLEGDKIVVIESGTRHAISSSAIIDSEHRARFKVTFAEDANDDAFTYDAIYPAESVIMVNGIDSEAVKVMLPAEQHPTSNSFDHKAEIIIAKRATTTTQPTELKMRFKRLTAMGALTLENMPAKSLVNRVTISMEDNLTLAGENIINCQEGRITDYGHTHPSSSLLLTYDTPHEATKPIYFICNPVVVDEGETFTITVTTTDDTTYTRIVTIAEDHSLAFTAGEIKKFKVDMNPRSDSEDEFEDEFEDGIGDEEENEGQDDDQNDDQNEDSEEGPADDDTVGDDEGYTFRRVNSVTSGKSYLIAASEYIATPLIDKDYGYLQPAIGDSDNDGIITLNNCNNAFIIESTSGGYTLRQAADGRYLYMHDNYDSFNVSISPTEGYIWNISSHHNDTFIINNNSKNKFIQYNNAFSSFGGYKEFQSAGVYPMLYELDGDIFVDDTPQDGDIEDDTTEDSNGDNIPDITPGDDWYEMPAIPSQESYPDAVTVVVMDGNERNYTHYYDKSTYTTMWVAYPLESKHMGSYSRPGSWNWNPYINTDYQVDLRSHSYTNSDTYVRGHLIPNASRNGIRNMQLQTFYVTNSVPQIHNSFNSGIWQNLEAALQGVGESERIYIVTGVAFNKVGESRNINYTTAKDDTKLVPIPNYFYKVVLKVNTKSSGEVTAATTVGFWFENKAYSGTTYDSYATTVDQIEEWTGFDFFINLPDAIESTAEQNSSWSSFRAW